MTDDRWRPENPDDDDAGRRPGRLEAEMDRFDDDEFGGPLFADTSETEVTKPDAEPEPERLSLDEDDSGAMPHWTESATGDVPKIDRPAASADPTDDLDVWSTFTSDTPVWKEGDPVDRPSGQVPTAPADPTGEIAWENAPVESSLDADLATEAVEAVPPSSPEPARITIGTDPSGMPRRPAPQRRGKPAQRPPSAGGPPLSPKRNLPVAIATGLLLAAAFLALTMWRPAGAIAFVTVILGLASIEYFSKVTEKGYRPAVAVGVAACVVAPLVAYWVGETGLPMMLAFAFLAGSLGFIGAESIEVGPMPNMAITTLGIVWIGIMGSFAALIIRYSNFFGGDNPIGTDTIVLVAIGVVANDVGAFFVGSAFGRTPLRSWISPNKSVEGFLGGTILTLVAMLLVGMRDLSDTWSATSHLLMLGIVISIFAPLGDLTESMFKRNLDVKDFGSIVKGHGGILDRFDGFLFALPAVYYLMRVVEPWTQFAG
ncbi:MAG: phosphatidate cytidylyltransferase [Ilumatobacter sp.]|nr:phosphatidate cytidylyltransferase [Ilumatobacter sp.]